MVNPQFPRPSVAARIETREKSLRGKQSPALQARVLTANASAGNHVEAGGIST